MRRWRCQVCPSPCHCFLINHAALWLHTGPLYGQAEGIAVGLLGQGYVLFISGCSNRGTCSSLQVKYTMAGMHLLLTVTLR